MRGLWSKDSVCHYSTKLLRLSYLIYFNDTFLSLERVLSHLPPPLENNCSECYALHPQHHDICSVSIDWAEPLINGSEERPSSWTRIAGVWSSRALQHLIKLITSPFWLDSLWAVCDAYFKP